MSEGEPTQTDFFEEIQEVDQITTDQEPMPSGASSGRTSRISPYPPEDPAKARKRDDSFASRWRR